MPNLSQIKRERMLALLQKIKEDVIHAGLITKARYVNEGLANGMEISDDYECLLDLADAKRRAIAARYQELGELIRPLVTIQFPNGRPETIRAVKARLKSLGYSYNNGMVSIWMSEDKRNLPDNLTGNDATPVSLAGTVPAPKFW